MQPPSPKEEEDAQQEGVWTAGTPRPRAPDFQGPKRAFFHRSSLQ